ncbi:MAG TPA: ABC transporter transmembrane domain-containing protein [Geminicoccaceae bacterium]|nr:ABC transporter transmembrane domain-containing protein [Geminicoccaceae bacterium]
MEPSIFSFIRRYSWKEQLTILGMSAASLPLLYLLLDLPKTIINEALSGEGPFEYLGVELDQLSYLLVLCGIFLTLVLISGGLKYILNVYVGVVAERMLRRLRYTLYSQVMRFPLPHLRRVSQGELVQLINAETEPLGGFVGDALSVPAVQGGTLLTTLLFMFMQDPILGLAAIALYPLQIWLIPKLQAHVNRLGKLRVRQVRKNAERISEMAASVRDIRANDATWYERSRFSEDLFAVYDLRFQIYKKKFMIKFLNNFIAQLGPFFFFSIGGYLVIQGNITIGALVAVVAAQKDMASPWRELLAYYQTLYDVKIKYEQTVMQFQPAGLRDPKLQDVEPEEIPHLVGELRAVAVVVKDDNDDPVLDNVGFTLRLPVHLALVGPAGGGKEELILVLAGLLAPDSGRVLIDGHDVDQLPEAVTGRRIAFVGSPSAIFSGTIEDNLVYGLKHRPVRDLDPDARAARQRARLEAARSGNSPYDLLADWVDYEAAGIRDPAERLPALVRVLRLVRLDHDVYVLGLRGSIEAGAHPDLAAALLEARRIMRERLAADGRLSRLVEPFHPDQYNTNATLGENLLFGTPIGATFDMERLAHHPYVLATLKRTGLLDELRLVGYRLATTMVELFADLPPEHEYFQQFSFIRAEDLPYYRSLTARVDQAQLSQLSAEEGERLLELAFKLVAARHRLGLLDDELLAKVLEARRYFRDHLPPGLAGTIAFFDPERYSDASTIQDNVLFGKIAFGQAQAAQRIADLLTQLLNELGLRERVIEVGLRSECGIGGARLSVPQRQKLALARAILKRPDILLMHDPLGPLDAADQVQLRDEILAEFRGRTVIWALQGQDWGGHFEQVVVLERGRVAQHLIDDGGGRPAERADAVVAAQ